MRPELYWRGKREIAAYWQKMHPQAGVEPASRGSLPNPLGWKILEGDNHAHLAALRPAYAGAFDLIYLDPPYNRGIPLSTYDDCASDSVDLTWLRAALGEIAADLEQTERWLCLVHSRLLLVSELLAPGGVVIASIDSAEVHHLAVLFREILSSHGEVRTYAWPPFLRQADTELSARMNYLLVYAPPAKQRAIPVSVVGSSLHAHADIASELGRRANFDTPKPQSLLRHVLREFAERDALVLDPYAGSGSLGVAVTAQNRADGGTRRCVLIERSASAIALMLERANSLAHT